MIDGGADYRDPSIRPHSCTPGSLAAVVDRVEQLLDIDNALYSSPLISTSFEIDYSFVSGFDTRASRLDTVPHTRIIIRTMKPISGQ
jgi:hypothetical protein